ncbi:glycosyltransferase family 2 protein [Calderihabitans maritimus]|uniref:Glycosyl transferase n=1 Tax=Calderihabitans maritimus TaxID=1246530 RepID=A0A1Z5HWY5_9FIRM|nr:glycosyltransferase family 2 protein [Calderihabitans maritimus]GAW94024.1 glycosyl transferase [Calderihabitans maritimus]
MRFSLVLATVDRTEEVKRFLEHLDRQTYRDFELIVVDQNPDDRLEALLHPYRERFRILHLRSAKGLSRARNVGLKCVGGDIIGFPDDDCWYPPNLLERVAAYFCQNHPGLDGVTGRCVDENGEPSVGRWDLKSGSINRFNVWNRGTSASLFVRVEVARQIGAFDEALGAGAGTPWGSGEEIDYLLRALEAGFHLYYEPGLFVYHPQPVKQYDVRAVIRARSYGAGMGRVLRKHSYPIWFVAYQWLRSAGGIFLSLAAGRFNKAIHHWAALQGKFLGWIAREG